MQFNDLTNRPDCAILQSQRGKANPINQKGKRKMRNFFRNFDFDLIDILVAIIILCQIAIIISVIMMAITK